ncbi:MAG TPA: lipopolysaccharide kinase InaA family protein [Thermoanaerobaculia bacterium]|jgi:tRNA A-37 threonylcarbamoyl transferase component Bud32|nr:lipopolysaccharide kinase InaA family protein [Thermoanaerobaculia bacterium]
MELRPADLAAAIERLTDPGAALRTLHWGRNYLYVSRLETAAGPLEVVVKQFRHRSLRDRLRRRLAGSKAAKSWRVANAILAAGLQTPEPVMLLEAASESGPAFYVCRHLPDVTEARYLFRAANAGEEAERFPGVDFPAFVEALGKTARRLHDAGFWHRDLSGGNVLLRFGAAGRATDLYLVDLNRTRSGRPPSTSERLRDLSRLALFRPEHQELLLASYWGEERIRGLRGHRRYLAYQRGFVLKNESKKRVRGWRDRLKHLVLPRPPHAHIPEAPTGAGARDKVVWDRLSDQPHQHAGRLDKLRVRLADVRAHAGQAAVVAAALPRIWRRYRQLQGHLQGAPVDFGGIGVCVRPWPEAPEAPVALVAELGVRHVLLRLHPWEDDHDAEEELARTLHARGCELTFALPQNRELVRDPARWRGALESIGPRFAPYGPRFQIGQAINRSKWGVWNVREYVELARTAGEVLRRQPGVELLGPSVIDFEYHVTAGVLNLRRAGFRFDVVSALLYVDRRGAPENRQAGLDTVDKVVLLKAIAETARNAAGRCWITEVNWPLREGPHSPAGRDVAVDEETQADHLVRYYLLTLGTGLVERVFWWQMVARGYGLVDPADPANPRRRPSFLALKTLVRELDGARLEEVLPAPPPARLYRFRRPDGTEVVVGWSAAGTAKAILPRPAAGVTGRDGEELAAAGTEVELGPSPRYFRL